MICYPFTQKFEQSYTCYYYIYFNYNNHLDNHFIIIPRLPEQIQTLPCFANWFTLLPELPGNLQIMYYNEIQHAQLPELSEQIQTLQCFATRFAGPPELPGHLHIMYCNGNQLTQLPEILEETHILCCSRNQLTQLPALPGQLRELYCFRNQLTKLPTLPRQIQVLDCDENPLLYLPISLLVSGCYVVMSDKEILYKKGVGYMIIHQFRKRRFMKWILQWACYPVMYQLFGCSVVMIINGYL